MRRRYKALVAVAGLILLSFLAYSEVYPAISLRYRLTLEVDVGGVRHTGSGVVEIVYKFEPHLLNIDNFDFYPGHFYGSAITVDLGDDGLLLVVDARSEVRNFATRELLTPRYTTLASLPLRANDFGRRALVTEPQSIRAIKRNRKPINLPLTALPMLVRFRSHTDASALDHLDLVDPYDLPSSFGAGARIARVTFEITDDPITPMPKRWPKWLADSERTTYSPGYSLPAVAFKGE
jgi:hypothetical protein